MEEEICDAEAPSGFMESRRRSAIIGRERRLQLLRFAEKIAADVLENTKTHERCLLRRMVENLLPGED